MMRFEPRKTSRGGCNRVKIEGIKAPDAKPVGGRRCSQLKIAIPPQPDGAVVTAFEVRAFP